MAKVHGLPWRAVQRYRKTGSYPRRPVSASPRVTNTTDDRFIAMQNCFQASVASHKTEYCFSRYGEALGELWWAWILRFLDLVPGVSTHHSTPFLLSWTSLGLKMIRSMFCFQKISGLAFMIQTDEFECVEHQMSEICRAI